MKLPNWLGFTSRKRREALVFHLFISPWLLGLLIFTIGPMIASMVFSFTKYNVSNPPVFVGLRNYRYAFFEDDFFWHSLRVTFTYALLSVPLQLVVGFVIALLLNTDIPGVAVWRTLYYLPSVLTGVAVAVLWMLIFQPKFGVINSLLALVGIEGPLWIYSKDTALISLVLMSVWGAGGSMIIYLSGLQGIPTVLYEVATIDGAGAWIKFWKITLPMMTPIILFNLIMGIIGSLQTFTNAYVMTQGGPQNATLFYSLKLYFAAFRDVRMGYASMLAWVLFLIILALTLLVLRSSEAWVYYEGELRK
jgi:multiple sugar transport system permease protein